LITDFVEKTLGSDQIKKYYIMDKLSKGEDVDKADVQD
jgi:hypothetical protein